MVQDQSGVAVALYCTVGVHPHNATQTLQAMGGSTERLYTTLKSLAQNVGVVAIGEAGLDYNRMFSSIQDQKTVFEVQLRLALELQLPLFLHERDAHQDFLAVVSSFPQLPARSVVHCFTGTDTELFRYLDLGFYIGLTGFVTEKKRAAHLRPHIAAIPGNRLMIETDSPFMTPHSVRPRPACNEPRHLIAVAQEIALLSGRSLEEVARECLQTTLAFFSLPQPDESPR
ncbi:hypothetical protein HDU91_002549 [Kappamyces sp. JEL0680]|nr:hypothetical protein HDU91_002549 [Kappamyces sp. JEL0680]